jgi:hypothetical protein
LITMIIITVLATLAAILINDWGDKHG